MTGLTLFAALFGGAVAIVANLHLWDRLSERCFDDPKVSASVTVLGGLCLPLAAGLAIAATYWP